MITKMSSEWVWRGNEMKWKGHELNSTSLLPPSTRPTTQTRDQNTWTTEDIYTHKNTHMEEPLSFPWWIFPFSRQSRDVNNNVEKLDRVDRSHTTYMGRQKSRHIPEHSIEVLLLQKFFGICPESNSAMRADDRWTHSDAPTPRATRNKVTNTYTLHTAAGGLSITKPPATHLATSTSNDL